MKPQKILSQLTIINNIPTPYRNYTFSILQDELERRGMALNVYFMAETEPNRFWSVNPMEWGFNGKIFPGIKLWMHTTRHSSGFPIYVNPGIWASVINSQPTWLILAGSWHMFTVTALLTM